MYKSSKYILEGKDQPASLFSENFAEQENNCMSTFINHLIDDVDEYNYSVSQKARA